MQTHHSTIKTATIRVNTVFSWRATGLDEAMAVTSDLSDTVRPVTQMTATDAARSFSDVLNRVAAGEEIEVIRSGAPVAVIAPPKAQLLSAARFRELITGAPLPDDEFAADVRAARSELAAPADPWLS